ncbi:MAG: preprotein translocase subunit YajC [Desulfobacterales bacterium]|nr:preprotein translocase subunit YajC [Desulfobacterales bacterium]MDJ0912656.1 preprotein translocase subunit YajC [Desulfobacterales bacterium]
MIDIAYAMGQGGAAGGQGGGGFTAFVPLILMFVIFYFLLIRPQQKKAKDHRQMIENLKKGDRVVTGGGIHGRITGISDTTLTVEISDKVRVKVNRGSVSSLIQSSAQPQAPKAEKTEASKKK